MCAQAVVAQIAFSDSKTNLFLDFCVESPSMQRAAEIDISFQRCRCVPEHTEKVGRHAEFGLHLVEHCPGLASGAFRVKRLNSIPVLQWAHLWVLSRAVAAIQRTRCMPSRMAAQL